jgi:WhiB family redox-sensing transcriptional regulator
MTRYSKEALQALLAAVLPGTERTWRQSALCAQTDPERFFPEKGGSTREAKDTCRRCPVKAECLEDSKLGDWGRFGIWAGLSERERRNLAKKGEAA